MEFCSSMFEEEEEEEGRWREEAELPVEDDKWLGWLLGWFGWFGWVERFPCDE